MLERVRTVITGADVLCPLGTTWRATSEHLQKGASGVRPITLFDASTSPAQLAAEVPDWIPDPMNTRVGSMLERTAHAALLQAGIDPINTRLGLSVSVGRVPTSLDTDTRTPAMLELARTHDAPARAVAAHLNINGPLRVCYSACASGNDAIGLAVQMIRRRQVDAVVCGAADAQIAPISLIEFSMLGALAEANSVGDLRHPKPFDAARNGFVLGEGASMFVLESLNHAQQRSAGILAEVLGYGCTSDAHSLVRGHPSAVGPANAMQAALEDAHLLPEQVDYINAHGTGTVLNDRLETLAIKQAFGHRATRVAVSSTKSMTGHLLASAGAVEAAFCLMAMHDGFIPPTINFATRDPECDLDYVFNSPRRTNVNVTMSNAFGFGGHNSVLVLGRP